MDKTGVVTQTSDVRPTKDELEAVLGEFTGVIEQASDVPSRQARRENFYDLAGKGIEVERKPRKVEVKSLASGLCGDKAAH